MPVTEAPVESLEYAVIAEVSVPQAVEYFRQRPFYRVRIEVTQVSGFFDHNLFVHERVAVGMTAEFRDEFLGVAGPVDLADYSDVPDDRMRLLKDSVDMLIESHELYEELINSVTAGLQELVEGMRRLDQMQVVRTIHIT